MVQLLIYTERHNIFLNRTLVIIVTQVSCIRTTMTLFVCLVVEQSCLFWVNIGEYSPFTLINVFLFVKVSQTTRMWVTLV